MPKAKKLTPPLAGMLYAIVNKFGKSDQFTTTTKPADTVTADIAKANVITSMVAEDVTKHKFVVDVDFPVTVIESSTPGHSHLYIDFTMEKDVYFELLAAMVKAGLVEEGYVGASESRGFTSLRLPWVKKDPADYESGVSETGSFNEPVEYYVSSESEPW